MLDKIKKLIEIHCTSQKKRDERFKDFHEFHKWLLKTVPIEIQKIMRKNERHICTHPSVNFPTMAVDLTVEDYEWWAEEYKQNPLIILKDIKEIQKEVYETLEKLVMSNIVTENTKDLDKALKLIDEKYK